MPGGEAGFSLVELAVVVLIPLAVHEVFARLRG